MAINGLRLLPPQISEKDALAIYRRISSIKNAIDTLNEEINQSMIKESILQIFSLKESIDSTRIEGAKVTMTDMFDHRVIETKAKEINEVQNYQNALNLGIQLINDGQPISIKMIRQLHDVLMGDNFNSIMISGRKFRSNKYFQGLDNNVEDAINIPNSDSRMIEYIRNMESYNNAENDGDIYNLDSRFS